MGEQTPEFQALLGKLEGRLATEFLLFLRDLEKHRSEKFALECLIDQLRRLSVTIPAGIARDILQRCDVVGMDQGRRGAVPGLLDFSSTIESDVLPCSLEDLLAVDDPAAFGKAHGAGELLIVRALREKFGISFDEAMDRLRAAKAPR